MRYLDLRFITCCVTSCIFTPRTFLLSQNPSDNKNLSISYFRQKMSDDYKSYKYGLFELFIKTNLREQLNLFGEIQYYKDSFSNLFFGFEYLRTKYSSSSITGFYIPTAESGSFIEDNILFSNFTEYFKYMSGILTFTHSFSYFKKVNGFDFGFEIGPDVLFLSRGSSENLRFNFHYGFSINPEIGDFFLISELKGFVRLTGYDYDFIYGLYGFNPKTVNSFLVGFGHESKVRPMIFIMTYIEEELRNFIDYVVGLKIDF